jgi:hypothetical protein
MCDNSKSRFFPKSDANPPVQEDDICQLQGWNDNLKDYLENGGSPNRHTAMIFRPHKLAWDAMMRLSVSYLYVIQQVQEFLNNVEKHFTKFGSDAYNNNTQTSEDFHWSMVELSMQIDSAIETIRNGGVRKSARTQKKQPTKNSSRFRSKDHPCPKCKSTDVYPQSKKPTYRDMKCRTCNKNWQLKY